MLDVGIVNNPRTAFAITLFAALALVALAYAGGLRGPFLFDDFAVLPALGAQGPIHDATSILRFITSGNSDPIGRPLSMATFLANATDWPAEPLPFKVTNVALHLLNTALLACLLRCLGQRLVRTSAHPSDTGLAAVLAAAAWALHPLFLSTTLYVVQREAMLSATFVMAGMLCWLHGQSLLGAYRHRAGIGWCIAGSIVATTLAAACKANGLLLPLMLLVVEFTLPMPDRPASRVLRRVLLVLPAAVLVAYLGWRGIDGVVNGIGTLRPWSLAQRLLTEPRVLFSYLHALWLPRPYAANVFNDQVRVSVSLLSPWTTSLALVALSAMTIAAVVGRRRHPALAMAWLFFVCAQLMESSTIALELYFQHRNYLAAAPMFWPLALAACTMRRRTGQIDWRPRLGAGVVLLSLAGMTAIGALLWSQPVEQAFVWAANNPESMRAQTYAARMEEVTGHPERAIVRLTPLAQANPRELQIVLGLADAYCASGHLPGPIADQVVAAMATTRDVGSLISQWVDKYRESGAACTGVDAPFIRRVVAAGLDNPLFAAGRRQDLLHTRGMAALDAGDAEDAIIDFQASLALAPSRPLALSQAAALGQARQPAAGLAQLAWLDRHPPAPAPWTAGMAAVHDRVLAHETYWQHEESLLRSTLLADLTEQGSTIPP